MTVRNKIAANDRVIQMGNQLKELRKFERMTVEELSEKLDVSPRMIYNYENGNNILSIEMIVRIYEINVFKERSLEELVEIFIIQIYK